MPDEKGHLKVVGLAGVHDVPLADVFWLGPIALGFWKKLDGSANFGFSYTQSNEAAQYLTWASTPAPGSTTRTTRCRSVSTARSRS